MYVLLTKLMRELLTHDCDGGAEAGEDGDGEGRADGQAVDEVVKSVTERDHPRQRLHARQPRTATLRRRRLYIQRERLIQTYYDEKPLVEHCIVVFLI